MIFPIHWSFAPAQDPPPSRLFRLPRGFPARGVRPLGLARLSRGLPAHSILVRPHMEFRVGSPADAEAIAGLIASFQSELTDDPSGAGAEGYLASVSVQAEREYLASERYRYLLAYSEFSTCRVYRHPRWLPPFSPLCRALTSAPGHCSALVGASLARAVRSQQRRRLYGQLKPFRRAGVSSLRLCSSRVNTEYAWHLVSAHAASGSSA